MTTGLPYTPRALPAGFLARPIAHRGLHDAAHGVIENTAPAFAAALARGYGIECDVQPDAAGEPMVFHDETLERLTEAQGAVRARTAEALRTLRFRTGTAGMDRLSALLAQVAGRVPLVVEIKSAFDGATPQAARLAALAAAYHGPLAFKSFDPAQVVALRAAGVRQPLGVVVTRQLDHPALDEAAALALGRLDHLETTHPDFLSVGSEDLPSARIAALRAAGLPVMSWTIRTPRQAEAVAPHIDQIVFEGFAP